MLIVAIGQSMAADPPAFDGRPWNVSTGNASVTFIQASPIGAHPRPGVYEDPPPADALKRMREAGLVAYEDYVAWGAVEREPGKWDWTQHDRMERAMHAAGLKYVVYDWVHFPPVWLRQRTGAHTLMRCVEHGEETNYLSIFDPRTIEWYDHFYKALHDHFGDRIDDVYACILGPYGEGNYPLRVPDWVDMGHCHEGYWCGDRYAIEAFGAAMRGKYGNVEKLNLAWGTTLASLDDVRPPRELSDPKFKPSPAAFATPQDRRRWLDFITWYHQAIIDFAERSVKTVLKYWPAGHVRLKPGGTARGINPIAWGTYSPGYARMARAYRGIVLQPADCAGAVFADKWLATAYRFYGVKLGTEPAGGLDDKTFVRRVFSDASCGASQIFTYEFERHAADIRKYAHLYTGEAGQAQVAVFCPTTWYRLGGDVTPTIRACDRLRDVCEFDVLDELLITDGALTPSRYKALVIFQGEVVDQPVLDRLDRFRTDGGRIVVVGDGAVRNVEGRDWAGAGAVVRTAAAAGKTAWVDEVARQVEGLKGVDGRRNGVWTTRRGRQLLLFNSTDKAVHTSVDGQPVELPPYGIAEVQGH
ncbi:MAG TPA: family 14 glycosylhydrolase [Tepidisphaeraceae bacterium]